MTLYLLNSPVLTDHGLWRFAPLCIDAARELAAGGFVSAIGHEGAARLLGELLKKEVEVSRIRVHLAPGDRAIVLRVRERLPEGVVLDRAALDLTDWELSLLTRLE